MSPQGTGEGGFDLSNIDPKDVTREVARWLIGNPVNAFVMQHRDLVEQITGVPIEDIIYAAGFEWIDGVQHARQDALQQYGGYNFLYDIIFDYATSMEAHPFEFT